MIRTTLIAIATAATLGSASAALAALDGDNNPVPGTSAPVNRPTGGFDRSFAGPYRQAAPVTLQDRSYFDRHTQID